MTTEDILILFQNKTIDKKWSFSEYTPSLTSKWSHGYHRYPAKFIPQLVEKLLKEYITTKNAHINDPFHGCGTTIVSAISQGFKASGTDINKIAHLITKVKATPIEPCYLSQMIKDFLQKIDNVKNKKMIYAPLIPDKHIDRINFWFTENARDNLGSILRIITEYEDENIRDFFLVAFSHILKSVSIWLQSSTKPTRDFKKKAVLPFDALRRHLNKMEGGNNSLFHIIPKNIQSNIDDYLNIKISDAKIQPVASNSVDMIISSSPYVTSYEYADLHQLSTIWLDYADDLVEYKKKFIGTVYKKYEDKEVASKIASKIILEMSAKSTKMAKEIEAFFLDMEDVFKESYRILQPGGRACFVIGNTKLKKVNIINAEVFAESMQFAGFKIDRIIKREIPSKILPQKRDEKTGRFASNDKADSQAYPIEYIVIGLKS